jgi:hypothetical protein
MFTHPKPWEPFLVASGLGFALAVDRLNFVVLRYNLYGVYFGLVQTVRLFLQWAQKEKQEYITYQKKGWFELSNFVSTMIDRFLTEALSIACWDTGSRRIYHQVLHRLCWPEVGAIQFETRSAVIVGKRERISPRRLRWGECKSKRRERWTKDRHC